MASNYAETAVIGLNPTIVAANVVVGDFPWCLAGVSTPAAAATCTSGLPSYEGGVHCLPAALVQDTPDKRPPSRHGLIGTPRSALNNNNNNKATTMTKLSSPGSQLRPATAVPPTTTPELLW
jgi:hypothetical protein